MKSIIFHLILVLNDTLEAITNEQHNQKPLTTIIERKPLPAHLQQFVNRLSTPKKLSDESTSSLSISQRALTPQFNENNTHYYSENQSNTSNNTTTIRKSITHHYQTNNIGISTNGNKPMKAFAFNNNDVSLASSKMASGTNETVNEFSKPNSSIQLKKSASKNAISVNETSSVSNPTPIRKHSSTITNKTDSKVIGAIQVTNASAFTQSSSNGNIVNLTNGFQSNNLVNSKKSNSNSNSTLSQQNKQKQQKTTKVADATQYKFQQPRPFSTHVSDSKSQLNVNSTVLAIIQPYPVNETVVSTISDDLQETESFKLEEESDCSSNSVSVIKETVTTNPNTTDVASVHIPLLAAVTVAASFPAKISILSQEEEEYKKKLEEKRREAREKAAKEAEQERQRQEAIRVEEEKRRKEDEELERIAEEEQIRLHRLAREQEEERLRLAIEQNERIENERRLKEELEKKQVSLIFKEFITCIFV